MQAEGGGAGCMRRAWLHVGAQLWVKGPFLNYAVLPSLQLVASGLAAPALLAFNLSGSGNSSLMLDGCTAVATWG